MKLSILPILLLALSAFADDKEVTNEDIINELKGGKTAYVPDHVLFNFKPISLIVGQAIKNTAPFPMKCLQLQGKIYKNLGFQAEPVFVLGGYGGTGFTFGPTYIPDFPWEEMHVTPKYELDYINHMGAYHGFMIEMTRHHLFGLFVLTYGGAVGFGVTGARAGFNSRDEMKIFEVEQGIAYDVNLGLGFAL